MNLYNEKNIKQPVNTRCSVRFIWRTRLCISHALLCLSLSLKSDLCPEQISNEKKKTTTATKASNYKKTNLFRGMFWEEYGEKNSSETEIQLLVQILPPVRNPSNGQNDQVRNHQSSSNPVTCSFTTFCLLVQYHLCPAACSCSIEAGGLTKMRHGQK